MLHFILYLGLSNSKFKFNTKMLRSFVAETFVSIRFKRVTGQTVSAHDGTY